MFDNDLINGFIVEKVQLGETINCLLPRLDLNFPADHHASRRRRTNDKIDQLNILLNRKQKQKIRIQKTEIRKLVDQYVSRKAAEE